MNILIFGYGLQGSGFESALYFLNHGHDVRLTDIRNEVSLGESIEFLKEKGVQVYAGGYRTEDFQWADIVVKAPSIRPENEFLKYASHVESDYSYLFTNDSIKQIKVILIAGSKGKTVTTSALCHSLNALGKKTRMCGNMGNSPFAELELWEQGDIPEYLVCELSAWQLRDARTYLRGFSPEIEASVITGFLDDEHNTVPGANAKLILCPKDLKKQVSSVTGRKERSLHSIESASSHISKALPDTLETAFAVLYRLGFKTSQINLALKSFRGIPNRSELVLRTDNMLFINDSCSSIPQAVEFTMANYQELPVHLICGGTGKTLNAISMLSSLRKAASIHLLDGSFTKKSLIPLLEAEGLKYEGPFVEIKDAVLSAKARLCVDSKSLQVVLLSPGASGFEYFHHETDRGNEFRTCVEGL